MSEFLDKTGLTYFWGKLKTLFDGKADGNTDGAALSSEGIPFGRVDSTSTATAFTATVPCITEYKDGTVVMLKNGVVTSTTNFTLNINGLGAKPCYNNMATGNDVTPTNPTRDTTIFNINYTMMFVYQSDLVSGGAWICYRGYDANTNTIGYQLRTNSTVMVVSDTARYYKLYFTSADGTMWVPASVNSVNNATSARPVNQRPINPFGRIVYTSANTNYAAGANLAATTIWDQYALVLGYSFNRTGAALTLTAKHAVYVKCAPQTDGSAIMDADTPIVQALPSTEDGKIYIYLGIAYSATNIELYPNHPVYYYKDGAIRLWTNSATSSVNIDSIPTSGSTNAVSSGGVYNLIHVTNGENDVTTDILATDYINFGGSERPRHKNTNIALATDIPTVPTKTSDLTNDSGFITSAQAPVQSVNGQTGAVSITIPTVPSAATASPLMDGTAAVGSSEKYAKEDHVHPTDTSRQATLVSGTNIKTINNESLLGSGNINIQGGGGTALTDAEIEAAVDAAFPIVIYNLSYPDYYPSSVFVTINTDGDTTSAGGYITQAEGGSTVTVVIIGYLVYATRDDTSASITVTNVSSSVYTFQMPDSDVTLNFVYDD